MDAPFPAVNTAVTVCVPARSAKRSSKSTYPVESVDTVAGFVGTSPPVPMTPTVAFLNGLAPPSAVQSPSATRTSTMEACRSPARNRPPPSALSPRRCGRWNHDPCEDGCRSQRRDARCGRRRRYEHRNRRHGANAGNPESANDSKSVRFGVPLHSNTACPNRGAGHKFRVRCPRLHNSVRDRQHPASARTITPIEVPCGTLVQTVSRFFPWVALEPAASTLRGTMIGSPVHVNRAGHAPSPT